MNMLMRTSRIDVHKLGRTAGVSLLGLCLLSGSASGRDLKQWVSGFNADDRGLQGEIPNDKALDFMKKNVPRFECPDEELERTYYFRWWTFRKHIRKTPEGYVVTEFLPEVPWAREYNTINCPAGHHFREGRWLHDPEILSDYARFYFGGGGNPRQYSFWAADSILQFCNVTGDQTLATGLLDKLVENYHAWKRTGCVTTGCSGRLMIVTAWRHPLGAAASERPSTATCMGMQGQFPRSQGWRNVLSCSRSSPRRRPN